MKRITLAVLCCILSIFLNDASAQNTRQTIQPGAAPPISALGAAREKSPKPVAESSAADIEALKRRVEEIENQNRLLIETVNQLKAMLEQSGMVEKGKNSPSTAPASSGASTAQANNDQTVRWSELVGEGNKIKFYGFLRLDLDFDSQRPNNTQTPLFITSPDPLAGGNDNGDFSMHPRLTRFGIDYSGPRIGGLGDAKLVGKLETDFENGGTESRQIIRIRHAYLRLDWEDFSLLAGQTWDTVSPLFPTVNNDTLQWNAGNVGDRRPQLRAAYEPKAGRGKFSFVVGLGLTGAIDAVDLDNNGFRDGEESALPDFQARVGYSHPLDKDRSVSFGVSGFYGFLKTSRPVAGRTEFRSQLVNIDFTLPLLSRLALRGEGWWGRNMSDTRGGAGQGINLANGREIRGRGGWSEANIRVSRYVSINPGFSTDDPVDEDLPGGGRTRNRAFYVANRITPGGNFLIGADYLRWRTDFRGFRRGIDNRMNIFFQYGF
ncbi:MAG TPA: DcaP family trimeric outer membrane transporter [Blastocatellia bacterium]|nr:DcaP family trimeric outer membrane transporter [Blastocatellia bacterium]